MVDDLEGAVTVEELISDLQAMPPTAVVTTVQYDDIDLKVIGCDYVYGRVVLETERLDDEPIVVFTDEEGD